MVLTGMEKVAASSIRFFQLAFAIALVGILSYIINEFNDYTPVGYWLANDVELPREVLVSEVVSLLAIVFTIFGIVATFFLGHYSQFVAAALDFIVWVGYITSAALLHNNYQNDGGRDNSRRGGRRMNPLEKKLNKIRRSRGDTSHSDLNQRIVGAFLALVIVQIVLYFFTIVLSIMLARTLKSRAAAAAVAKEDGDKSAVLPPPMYTPSAGAESVKDHYVNEKARYSFSGVSRSSSELTSVHPSQV